MASSREQIENILKTLLGTEAVSKAVTSSAHMDHATKVIVYSNYQKVMEHYKKELGVELILQKAAPDLKSIDQLPMTANAAYVYCDAGLFYVNKKKNECIDLKLAERSPIRELDTFAKEIKAEANKPRLLSEEELGKLQLITTRSPTAEDLSCSQGCDFIVMSTPPDAKTVEKIPYSSINVRNVYVKSGEKLFYIQKSDGSVTEINVAARKPQQELNQTLQELKLAEKRPQVVTLGDNILRAISTITGHINARGEEDVIANLLQHIEKPIQEYEEKINKLVIEHLGEEKKDQESPKTVSLERNKINQGLQVHINALESIEPLYHQTLTDIYQLRAEIRLESDPQKKAALEAKERALSYQTLPHLVAQRGSSLFQIAVWKADLDKETVAAFREEKVTKMLAPLREQILHKLAFNECKQTIILLRNAKDSEKTNLQIKLEKLQKKLNPEESKEIAQFQKIETKDTQKILDDLIQQHKAYEDELRNAPVTPKQLRDEQFKYVVAKRSLSDSKGDFLFHIHTRGARGWPGVLHKHTQLMTQDDVITNERHPFRTLLAYLWVSASDAKMEPATEDELKKHGSLQNMLDASKTAFFDGLEAARREHSNDDNTLRQYKGFDNPSCPPGHETRMLLRFSPFNKYSTTPQPLKTDFLLRMPEEVLGYIFEMLKTASTDYQAAIHRLVYNQLIGLDINPNDKKMFNDYFNDLRNKLKQGGQETLALCNSLKTQIPEITKSPEFANFDTNYAGPQAIALRNAIYQLVDLQLNLILNIQDMYLDNKKEQPADTTYTALRKHTGESFLQGEAERIIKEDAAKFVTELNTLQSKLTDLEKMIDMDVLKGSLSNRYLLEDRVLHDVNYMRHLLNEHYLGQIHSIPQNIAQDLLTRHEQISEETISQNLAQKRPKITSIYQQKESKENKAVKEVKKEEEIQAIIERLEEISNNQTQKLTIQFEQVSNKLKTLENFIEARQMATIYNKPISPAELKRFQQGLPALDAKTTSYEPSPEHWALNFIRVALEKTPNQKSYVFDRHEITDLINLIKKESKDQPVLLNPVAKKINTLLADENYLTLEQRSVAKTFLDDVFKSSGIDLNAADYLPQKLTERIVTADELAKKLEGYDFSDQKKAIETITKNPAKGKELFYQFSLLTILKHLNLTQINLNHAEYIQKLCHLYFEKPLDQWTKPIPVKEGEFKRTDEVLPEEMKPKKDDLESRLDKLQTHCGTLMRYTLKFVKRQLINGQLSLSSDEAKNTVRRAEKNKQPGSMYGSISIATETVSEQAATLQGSFPEVRFTWYQTPPRYLSTVKLPKECFAFDEKTNSTQLRGDFLDLLRDIKAPDFTYEMCLNTYEELCDQLAENDPNVTQQKVNEFKSNLDELEKMVEQLKSTPEAKKEPLENNIKDFLRKHDMSLSCNTLCLAASKTIAEIVPVPVDAKVAAETINLMAAAKKTSFADLREMRTASFKPTSKTVTPIATPKQDEKAFFERKNDTNAARIDERRKLIRNFYEKYLVHQTQGLYFENVYKNEQIAGGTLKCEYHNNNKANHYPWIIFAVVLEKPSPNHKIDPFFDKLEESVGLESSQWRSGLRAVTPEQFDKIIDYLAKSQYELNKAVTNENEPLPPQIEDLQKFQKSNEARKSDSFIIPVQPSSQPKLP